MAKAKVIKHAAPPEGPVDGWGVLVVEFENIRHLRTEWTGPPQSEERAKPERMAKSALGRWLRSAATTTAFQKWFPAGATYRIEWEVELADVPRSMEALNSLLLTADTGTPGKARAYKVLPLRAKLPSPGEPGTVEAESTRQTDGGVSDRQQKEPQTTRGAAAPLRDYDLPARDAAALKEELAALKTQLDATQKQSERDREVLQSLFSDLKEFLPGLKRLDDDQLPTELRSELQKLRDAQAELTRARTLLAQEEAAKAGLAEELTKARAQAAAAEQRAEGALRELLAVRQLPQVPAAREAFTAPPPELDAALSRERIAQLIKQGLKGHEEVHRLFDDAIERQKLGRDVLQPLLQRYVDALVGLQHLSRDDKRVLVARLNHVMRRLGLRAQHEDAIGPIAVYGQAGTGSLRLQMSRTDSSGRRRVYKALGTTFPSLQLVAAVAPQPRLALGDHKTGRYKYL